jgi:peroxiredoxin
MLFIRNINKLIILLIFFGVLAVPALAVQKGKTYNNLNFPPVVSEADQKYLGLNGTGAFKLDQIGAPYVVLEIMRTSCPHCQEQAVGMNKFYGLVQESNLKAKVKFLAVAQGSSAEGIKNFKRDYKVLFPMLEDSNGAVGQALKIEGVPTTVLLSRNGRVLRVHVGNIGSPKEALGELRRLIK